MYVIAREKKIDPVLRWSLPEKVFFACGACHILAYVAVDAYGGRGFRPYWVRPGPGLRGHHFVVSDGVHAFDYHGWSVLDRLLDHTSRKARRWWPDWSCELIAVRPDVLISETDSRAMGIHLREPSQFLYDPLPRARGFLARHAPPWARPAQSGDQTGQCLEPVAPR